MGDHKSKMAAPRVHSPFPSAAMDAPAPTSDTRLGGHTAYTDRAVEARTKKEMPLG